MTKTLAQSFEELVSIVARLRDPQGGCPWDLEQTHDSLTPYVIEEAYEVVEAITHTRDKLPEELGDLLLQVVLHAQVAKDEGTFTLQDVIEHIAKKLVHRHPHVFGDKKVKDSTEVLQNWERQKATEAGAPKSALAGVPLAMPALLRAQRLGDKSARVGFDWNSSKEVFDKVREEFNELVSASPNDEGALDEELGDLLFTLAQWARKRGRTAEELLQKANDKFIKRFQHMENHTNSPLHTLSPEQREALWCKAKKATT